MPKSSLSQRSRQANIRTKKNRKKLTATRRTNRVGLLTGRPQKWDRKKVVREVCLRIAEGELVTEVLKSLGVSHFAFAQAVADTEEYQRQYAEARKMQSHAIAARTMQVARGKDAASLERKRAIAAAEKHWKRKDPKNWRQRIEKLKSGLIARNKLEVDAGKWYTRVTNPREFGEKLDVTSADKPLPAAPATLLVKFDDGESDAD